MELKIIPTHLIPAFLHIVPSSLEQAFHALSDADLSTPDFSFYTSVASVFSSKIEGEQIDLDSYIKHRRDGSNFLPDYTRKIDDLYNAYCYAQQQTLCEFTLKAAHQILSKHLVTKPWQGNYRRQHMYVASEDGKIEYVAAPHHELATEMQKLMDDIELLKSKSMTLEEVFYFAAAIHLVFVKIHPWTDGNGRSGRLLEKWFLSTKLGAKAWWIQSEKMYYHHRLEYYQNLRKTGLEYKYLDYSKALSFLSMLPQSLVHS